MDLYLKRRLVGAAVLVVLAVIFLPILFEDALREEAKFGDALPEPVPSRELPSVSMPPQVPLPSAWAVQVGSFSRRENAQSLERTLRQAGFAAFIDETQTGEERLFRVRVGPVLDRDVATAMVAEIRQRLELDGFVVPHPDE